MRNTTKILLLIPVLWLTAHSCRQAAEKSAENALKKALENESGGNADVDIDKDEITIESDEGNLHISSKEKTWPANMPDEVTPPEGGEITSVISAETDEGNTWSVQYSGIPVSELDRYRDLLKSKGFKTSIMKSDEGGMVSGDKDKLKVMLTLGADGGALTVMQGKK